MTLLPRTGELIVQRGVASAEDVERAEREGRARAEPICSRLLANGVDEHALASVLAAKHGVPGVDLSRTAISLDLMDLVPRIVAEGDLILPLSADGGRIHLAMSRPADDRVLSEVRFVSGREVSPYIAVRSSLLRAVAEAYEARARGASLWRGRSCASGEPHLAAVLPAGEEAELLEVEPLPEEVEISIEPEAEVPVEPAPVREKRLVLVVDDEPEIRQLVHRMLESKGYAIEIAVDGAEALEKSERLVPDLVLLDAMLPKVHGFDACRRIKASARTRHVPVIMMTAIYRGWRFAQDARDSYGAVDYVEKPFRLDDLVQRIEKALQASDHPAAPEPEEDLGPQIRRGRDLLAQGEVSEAIKALCAAVRADPRSPAAQLHLGRALKAAGDAFGAMTALEHAAELAPGNVSTLRTLASIYEETGFRRKAAEVLERALPAARDDAMRVSIRKDLLRLIA